MELIFIVAGVMACGVLSLNIWEALYAMKVLRQQAESLKSLEKLLSDTVKED